MVEVLQDFGPGLPEHVRTALTMGVYDGVHLGHQSVIEATKARASALDAATAVITFEPHPALVLRPENAPRLLTTLEQRLELLDATGIDYVYLVDFTADRSSTTATEFIGQVVVDRLHAVSVSIGEDFHFGRGRGGNLETVREQGEIHGFEVIGLDLLRDNPDATEPVSSTAIRRLLAGGDVAKAAQLLGRPYQIRGVVIQGEHRGRTIGFPTANIPVNTDMSWPTDGVYVGHFIRANGDRFGCAINIGRRPTFHQHAEHSLLEAHVLDFDDDLYGENVMVEFNDFLRSEQRFGGPDELIAQLKLDVDQARLVLEMS